MDWNEAVTREDRQILEATDPDVCIDTRRRVEFHMRSDKPGLIIRQQLLALLQAHGEEEVYRGMPIKLHPVVSTAGSAEAG